MLEDNVKYGEIRLEDTFHEAKIIEPIPPNCIRMYRYPDVEKHDHDTEGKNLLPIQGAGTHYRQG